MKKTRVGGSKTRVGPSQMKKKGNGNTLNNSKEKKVVKGKYYHYNQNGHWLRNCPKYFIERKYEKETQGKYILLAIETCLVEYDTST